MILPPGGIVGKIENSCYINYVYNCGSVFSTDGSNRTNGGGIYGSADQWYVSHICSGYSLGLSLGKKNTNNVSLTNSKVTNDYYDMKNLSYFKGFSSSIWGCDSSTNNGYPYLKDLLHTHKSYNVTFVTGDDDTSVSRSISNVNGILYGNKTSGSRFGGCFVGGAIGYTSGCYNDTLPFAKGILSVASKITGTSSADSSVGCGYIAGGIFQDAIFEKTYYGSDVIANNVTNTIGNARATKLMTVPSFLKDQIGLKEYVSVDNVENDNTAVWVIKSGKLPELYYNLLRFIIISKDIENGKISSDKTQAIDGETVTITAIPNDGYELNKIYVNGNEITGQTFTVSGNSEVYATFSQKTPEYTVTVQSTENASALLTNLDNNIEPMLLMTANENSSEQNSLSASDGEEIGIETTANDKYTVDAVYVNGEEVTGKSFIVKDNSTVTMNVTSTDTSISATTGEALDIDSNSVTLTGSTNGELRYIRLWKSDTSDDVTVTDIEDGSGDYTVTVWPLEKDTTYMYQMTECGEIKSFTTLSEPDGTCLLEEYEEEDIPCLTSTTYKKLPTVYKLNITSSQALSDEYVFVTAYDENDKCIFVESTQFDGDTETTVKIPIVSDIKYCKVFVWDNNIKPLGKSEYISIN